MIEMDIPAIAEADWLGDESIARRAASCAWR